MVDLGGVVVLNCGGGIVQHRQRCKFKYWFFGHYHEDMVVEKKYVMLYEQIIRLKL